MLHVTFSFIFLLYLNRFSGLLASWEDWSEWSSCGTPCLESNRTRTAVCAHPDPDYSANVTCQGVPPLEVETCTENECGKIRS